MQGPPGYVGCRMRAIYREGPEGDDRIRVPVFAPQERAHAGAQFAGIERLQQVVVRPQIQAADPVGYLVTRRKHQNRRPTTAPAQLADYFEAGDSWQADVYNEKAAGLGASALECGLSIGGPIGSMPGGLKQCHNTTGQGRVIFHYENASQHPSSATCLAPSCHPGRSDSTGISAPHLDLSSNQAGCWPPGVARAPRRRGRGARGAGLKPITV